MTARLALATAALAALAIATVLALAAPRGDAQAPAPPVYVSLGDSLAVGAQPDAQGRDRDTTHGYVDVVGARLARDHPGLKTIKLGCGGATTLTLLRAGSCRPGYGPGSQLQQAERLLKANAGHVVAVTVGIGDNDVEGCVHLNGDIDQGCVRSGLAGIGSRLPVIARRLRAAAGPSTPVAGLADYDQFLAEWLNGAQGRRFAVRSVGVIASLNGLLLRTYKHTGIRLADAGPPFATGRLTTYRRLGRRGLVPLAVERICRLTWACAPPPVGFDDHANANGYRTIASVVLRALGVSSP